ncbi:MAG: 30S ribosomal protein S5 [Candidatus Lindowbacteria bacterium]|nr:30S ribosomal protein S5 [Candidatus Lindowbacteria bacterium]
MAGVQQRDERKPRSQRPKREPSEFIEKVIDLARVAKVVKGGRRFSFRATVAIGDGKGKIGLGCGKSKDVIGAIQKGIIDAKRNLIKINLKGTTIPHAIMGEFKAAKVMMKPACDGTGVIAGGPVRAISECAGITNILSKSLGTDTKINIAKAVFQGLASLRTLEEIAALRGKSIEELKY